MKADEQLINSIEWGQAVNSKSMKQISVQSRDVDKEIDCIFSVDDYLEINLQILNIESPVIMNDKMISSFVA